MASKRFETVAVAQRRAKKRLPRSVYGALIAGADKGLTAARQTWRCSRPIAKLDSSSISGLMSNVR
jgi:hypothetical protein